MLNKANHDICARLRTMVPMGRAFTVEERAAAAIVAQEAADEIERLRIELNRVKRKKSLDDLMATDAEFIDKEGRSDG